MPVRRCCCALLASLLAAPITAQQADTNAAPAAAQQGADAVALDGRVIGPEGEPMAAQVVVLHRIAAGTGATVATDTSDTDGSFTFAATGLTPDPDATYFVAVRYQGELYIGSPFRAPLPAGVDYVVQVGVPGTSATSMMGGGSGAQTTMPTGRMPGAEPFPYRAWLFLIIPLLVMALAGGYLLTRRQHPQRRRRTLLEIAALDEAHDSELAAGRIEDSTLYWAERRSLLERLERES